MAGFINDEFKLGGVPQSASRHVAMATCFDVWLGDQIAKGPIGFISGITITSTRTVNQIRHLNSVDAGIAVDTTMTPDSPTLGFNGFYVYKNYNQARSELAIASVGDTGANFKGVGPSAGRLVGVDLLMTIDQQQIPFDIIIRHVYPTSRAQADLATPGGAVSEEDASGGVVIGVYKNCTITNMSIPIQIATAGVSDTGNISVGYVASAA